MSEGYRVRLAKNGKEVMRWIDYHEPFDLLIIDPNLPDEAELNPIEAEEAAPEMNAVAEDEEPGKEQGAEPVPAEA